MSASIEQEVVIPASPRRVYEALTDAKTFSAFTGGKPAEIEGKAGGVFSCFGGMILGRNVELVPERRVVQAWRVANWPDGVFSIVRFELVPAGAGTKLSFFQAGFPDDARGHLEAGWHKMYWEPLRTYLG